MIGSKLGSYKILEALGEGGMGVVYVGEHVVLGRRAAIKVLHPDLARRPETVKRFLHEARSATRVKHPGLVDVFDFGTDEAGNAYLVMELLDGESLAHRLRGRGVPEAPWSVRVARQIAIAVDAVHAQGIVHRDLKPDNVFLCHDEAVPGGERVKVLDFGLAKAAHDDRGTSIRTRTGAVMGTPLYMSPEQCRGAGTPIDLRSDVYSLGCILYELLAGRPPFLHEGLGDLLVAHIHDAPGPPSSHGVPVAADLEGVVMRMLAKKPAERIQTMREVIQLLEGTSAGQQAASYGGMSHSSPRLVSGPPVAVTPSARLLGAQTTLAGAASQLMDEEAVPTRRRAPLLVGAGLLAAAAAVAIFVLRGEERPPAPAPAPIAAAAPPPTPAPEPERPAPSPAFEPIVLTIASDPPATLVRIDSVIECDLTPCQITRERGPGKAVFILRKEGFKNQEISLPLDKEGTHRFTLVKESRKPPAKAQVTGPMPSPKPRKPIKNEVLEPY